MFTAVGAWTADVVTLTGGTWAERVPAQRIAGDYFRVLGVQPVLGRTFLPEEGRGTDCPILLSGDLWRNWLGADPGIVGNPLVADGKPCRVVGVMPDGFLPPLTANSRVDVWMPLRMEGAQAASRTDHSLMVLSRLAPGLALEQARRRLDAEARQLAESVPEARGWGVRIVSLKEQIVGNPNKALFRLRAPSVFCC